jgi:hypothetical protein
MKKTFYYQLVDSQARTNADLRDVAHLIASSIAYTFLDATDIEVRENFYTFTLPASACVGLVGRLQKLGRVIAKKLPGLCSVALLHYKSDVHPDSRQLFKRVSSAKAIQACIDEIKADV